MSRLIQFNQEDGKVVDIIKLRDDATATNIAVIDGKFPEHEYKSGYVANLHYNAEEGLHYEYCPVEPIDEDEQYIDADTALSIILTTVDEAEDEGNVSGNIQPLRTQLTKKQAKEIGKIYKKIKNDEQITESK